MGGDGFYRVGRKGGGWVGRKMMEDATLKPLIGYGIRRHNVLIYAS